MTRRAAASGPLPAGAGLERLADTEALRQLARSCYELFEVPMRLYSASGVMLAEHGEQAAICALTRESRAGRKACTQLVGEVKRQGAAATEIGTIRCFTTALYEVVPLAYEGLAGGRFVIGPYLVVGDAGRAPFEPPASLLDAAPDIDRAGAVAALGRMCRLTSRRASALKDHLKLVVEMVMASGHDALVTSQMHLAAIRESHRALAEKEEDLVAAQARLKELESLKASFLSTISHELRTPLTSIIGYGDMLIGGMAGELRPEQLEFMTIIRRQSDQLLDLITAILDMSKMEKGKLKLDLGPVAVHDVLDDVVKTVTPGAVDKGVFVDLQTSNRERIPPVVGDGARLRQVFLNIIDNALKFSTAGDIVSLTVDCYEDVEQGTVGYILFAPAQRKVRVRISDMGPGIPKRERRRIFDAFYQVDQSSTREHAGTGLGLNIVKRLVDAHHGQIHVEDNEPTGCIFVVRLPAYAGVT